MSVIHGISSGEPKPFSVDNSGRVLVTGMQPSNSIYTISYDSVYVTYPTSTTEVYTSKNGGAVQEVVTVTYSDSTKLQLVSIVRS